MNIFSLKFLQVNLTLRRPKGGQNDPPVVFLNISETHDAFSTKFWLTLKNILIFFKSCQTFGGEGPEVRVIWKN